MKKFIFLLIVFIGFFGLNFSLANASDKNCETVFSDVEGYDYFSHIHCTRDIILGSVKLDKNISIKKVSNFKVNEVLIKKQDDLKDFLSSNSGSCENLSTIDAFEDFEDYIYSLNNISSYDSSLTNIENIEKEINELIEEHNDELLYFEMREDVRDTYPYASLDIILEESQKLYYDKQSILREKIVDKQKEKLSLLYRLSESQKMIENFYEKAKITCTSLHNKEIEEKQFVQKQLDEEQIEKYKIEFDSKVGKVFESLERQELDKLKVQLLLYSENSPLFVNFSEEKKRVIKLKVKGIIALINEKLSLREIIE